MSLSSTSSSWLYACLGGEALNSDSPSASISLHSNQGVFNLDLTKATGGSSSNPFTSSSTNTGSGSATSNSPSSSGSDPSNSGGYSNPISIPSQGGSGSFSNIPNII